MAAKRSDEYNQIMKDWRQLLTEYKGRYDKIPEARLNGFVPRIASANMPPEERRLLMNGVNSIKKQYLKQKPKNYEQVGDNYLFSPTGEVLSASEVRTLRDRGVLEAARSSRIGPKNPPILETADMNAIDQASKNAKKELKGFSRRNLLVAGLTVAGLALIAGPVGIAAGIAGGLGAIGAGALSVGATIASFGVTGLGVGILATGGVGIVRQIIRGRRDPDVLENRRVKADAKWNKRIAEKYKMLDMAKTDKLRNKLSQDLEKLYAKKVKSQQHFADLATAQYNRISARQMGGLRNFFGEKVALNLFHNEKYVTRAYDNLKRLTGVMDASNKTVEDAYADVLGKGLDVNKTHGKAFAKELEKAPEERNLNTSQYDKLYSKAIEDTFKANSKDYASCKNFEELAAKFSENTGISKDYINARKADFLVQYAQNRDSSLGGFSAEMQRELVDACVGVLKGGADKILGCESTTVDYLKKEALNKDSPIHEAFVESGVPQPKEGEELTEKQQEQAEATRAKNEEQLESTMTDVQKAQDAGMESVVEDLADEKEQEREEMERAAEEAKKAKEAEKAAKAAAAEEAGRTAGA